MCCLINLFLTMKHNSVKTNRFTIPNCILWLSWVIGVKDTE